jgi:hypothetical protein
MAGPHDRTVTSFPPSARSVLTNGGMVKGGNGLTYRYDPLSQMAVPVSQAKAAPAAPTAAAPSAAPRQVKRTSTPAERAGVTGPAVPAQPVVAPEDAAEAAQQARDAAEAKAAAEAAQAARRNAYEMLLRQFREYGLESLAPKIMEFLVSGYDPNTISLLLQDTEEYKRRFAGNEARRNKGIRVLSPGEYLAAEAAYRQALSSAGYPESFYDSLDDYADFIARDVSPVELKRRADAAMKFVNDSDPAYIDAFSRYYGASKGDVAAYFLDGGRNEQLLDKRVKAAGIGAAASRQGLSVPSVDRAERFVDQGVTEQQAQQAYGVAAGILPQQAAIASRFGDSYGLADAEDELLGGLASARRKRERLNRSEQALFEGGSGLGRDSLERNTGGSY